MKEKEKVKLVASSYSYAKNAVSNDELGYSHLSKKNVDAYRNIVRRVENCVRKLDEDDKYIIENEVLFGKKNKWYQGYLSISTYYRHSRNAYVTFLQQLEIS